MAETCSYCLSAFSVGEEKCKSCGAPVVEAAGTPDYRCCPYCRRRLLALASPACNYCGRRLPEHYIKAREGDLRRIGGINDCNEKGDVEEVIRLTARRDRSKSSSILGLFDLSDLTDLTDLFS